MIRCIPISGCADCPFCKRHYGQHECAKLNWQPVPRQEVVNGKTPPVPDWCPLPPHPSFNQPAANPSQQEPTNEQ